MTTDDKRQRRATIARKEHAQGKHNGQYDLTTATRKREGERSGRSSVVVAATLVARVYVDDDDDYEQSGHQESSCRFGACSASLPLTRMLSRLLSSPFARLLATLSLEFGQANPR